MSLYSIYRQELGIGETVNPVLLLDNRTELPIEWPIATVEARDTEDRFTLKGKILRAAQPLQQPSVNITEQGWAKIR